MSRRARGDAPPLTEYALIGDCHSCALVSARGSVDWCCLPRFDSGSCFARLLDEESGGHCAVEIDGHRPRPVGAAYMGETLVLQTSFEGERGAVRLLDFFAMREGGRLEPRRELVRIVECTQGTADVGIEVVPRFDYGAVRPWLRRAAAERFTAIGGDDGLMMWSDGEFDDAGAQDESVRLYARASLRAGERMRLVLRFVRPHLLEHTSTGDLDGPAVDARLDETLAWWDRWRTRLRHASAGDPAIVRSAITLKALSYAPTGAIVAAATTSLPEELGGERNWDYRFSWIRDSALSSNALADLGCEREAEAFRHFIVRSSAGHADDLQILYGIGGERRIGEQQLDLSGYGGSRPVRAGNDAANQLQLDALGELLNLAWRWHRRGHSPDDDEWRFFTELVETAVARWQEPDRGLWEWRAGPRHFVHSKASCWTAVDRGLRLAQECARKAPERRWRAAREEIRHAIETRGYDDARGVFVQCLDEPQLDAALLLLPMLGFVTYDDERMVRTAAAIHEELGDNGYIRRYDVDDGLPGREGAFLPCSFWLAQCYANQDRLVEGLEVFDRAMTVAGPQGLFAEEVDARTGAPLGNYPQTLTHLSHIEAAMALAAQGREVAGAGAPGA